MTFELSLKECKRFFSEPSFSSFFLRYETFLMREWNSVNGCKFREVFKTLLDLPQSDYVSTKHDVILGASLDEDRKLILKNNLMKLGPWRKGPFTISDVFIDSEWCSNMKWDRLSKWIGDDLTNKVVADIGCGSGYYMYRALSHKPKFVMGVDPSLLFNFQFHTLQHFGYTNKLVYLQSRLEDLGDFSSQFDTVICMGVLYHRRDPVVCLKQLKNLLQKSRGTCILETLIIPGEGDDVLNPDGRYAKMPNVHYIPTLNRLLHDLKLSGFITYDLIDSNQTTTKEQRATDWSTPTSLDSFLDPNDNNKTIEGYPAPIRVILRLT